MYVRLIAKTLTINSIAIYKPLRLSFFTISAAFMYSKGVKYFKNSNLSDILAIMLKKYIVSTNPRETDKICLLLFINIEINRPIVPKVRCNIKGAKLNKNSIL